MHDYGKLATLILRLGALYLMVTGGLTLVAVLLLPSSLAPAALSVAALAPSLVRVLVGVAVYSGARTLGRTIAADLA